MNGFQYVATARVLKPFAGSSSDLSKPRVETIEGMVDFTYVIFCIFIGLHKPENMSCIPIKVVWV